MDRGDKKNRMQQDVFLGQIISNRYVVQQYLDGGQYGSVYIGVNRFTQQPVAIKIDIQHRILCHEATVMNYLYRNGCTDIPKVGWFGLPHPENPQITCLVMDYFPHSLQDYYPETSITKNELMQQMISILQEIHGLGILHRDLKPKNFMWSTVEHRHIRLIDFGMATVYNTTSLNDEINRPIDTPPTGNLRFMSPFVKRGEVPTRRDDLISIGYIYAWLSTPRNTDLEKRDETRVRQYLEMCFSLGGHQTPDYEKLKSLFVF